MIMYRGNAQLIYPDGKVADLWGVVLKEPTPAGLAGWGGTASGGPGINSGVAQIRLSSGALLDVQIRNVVWNRAAVALVILDGVGDLPRIAVIQ